MVREERPMRDWTGRIGAGMQWLSVAVVVGTLADCAFLPPGILG